MKDKGNWMGDLAALLRFSHCKQRREMSSLFPYATQQVQPIGTIQVSDCDSDSFIRAAPQSITVLNKDYQA